MGTIINGQMAALLADLDRAVTRVIDKHFGEDAANGGALQYHGPLTVQISGVDGVIARFMEDGIDLYPSEEA